MLDDKRHILLRRNLSPGFIDVFFQLLVCLFEVVIHDDNVVHTGSLCELQLDLCLLQALCHCLLRLGAAAAESLLEGLEGWRLDEDVASFYA